MQLAFNLNALGWDAGNALFCARAAQRAYTRPPTIESKSTDTQVLIEDYPDFTTIAFRGTFDLHGWLRDFDARMLDTGFDTKVHAGFYDDVSSVLPDLLLKCTAGKPLVVIGHSKGAAEAKQCAWRLSGKLASVEWVYTFGEPRNANRAFANFYNARLRNVSFRVSHAADIVPWVPWCMGEYHHSGQEVFLKPNGRLVLNPSTVGKLTTNGLELYREYCRHQFGAGALLTNHPIERYLEALEQLQ